MTIMPDSAHENSTPRASHLTPMSPNASLSPTWGPPKSPLPPDRLAKLANALGVSTPVPTVHPPNSFLSRSYSESSPHAERFRRSPTPSTTMSTNFSTFAPTPSKYLLHVIPPLHLPHDSGSFDDSDTAPPPPNASGYHIQYRRGILVPLQASFHAQLGAIAKEYALPSTAGLILYLVSNAKIMRGSDAGLAVMDDQVDEPGPRLTEDIWKHLWTRIMKTEQRDENVLLLSRSATPNMLNMDGSNGRSTPFLTSPITETMHSQLSQSITPSPSTPSSVSDLRSQSKSAPPSSQSEPDTPDTSVEDAAIRANSFDLPGLLSPSVIPILAKVEFVVDKRRAPWFDPWLKSRKANHAKRAESRLAKRADSRGVEDEGDDVQERKAPVEFLIGRTQTSSPASFALSPADDSESERKDSIEEGEEEGESNPAGYEQLSESTGEDSDSEESEPEGDEFGEDATTRVSSFSTAKQDHDPLSDVFGTDADTWADIHASENGTLKHESNPNIVPLALTAAEVSALPDPADLEEDDEDDRIAGKEEDEVKELLEQMSKPHLNISIPDSPPSKRSSSPTRRHIPPPLVLVPKLNTTDLVVPAEPTPLSSEGDSTHLAYLSGSPEDADNTPSPRDVEHDEEDEVHEEEEFDRYARVRSPEDEKRAGALFEDLDLGLDPTEDFDDDDPNDRRRSQYLMKAQLDEIERTMAQLSPRILKADLEEEQNQSFQSLSLSPNGSSRLSLSPGGNTELFPPSPRLPRHPDAGDPSEPNAVASWPAVPFSAIKDGSSTSPPPTRADGPPSPPRLALNGVTTSAPKSYMPTRGSNNEVSAETVRRKRELEEEHALYPPLHSSGSADEAKSDSPVIPLSPDPFGRYPSTPTPEMGNDSRASSNWDIVTLGRGSASFSDEEKKMAPAAPTTRERSQSTATTSRFSMDSTSGEDPTPKPSNRSTLMSVKSIRKLWRKSKDKNSVSLPTPTSTAPSSGRASPQVPQRPERPSQENMDLPDIPDMPAPPTPTYGRFSPQPPPVQSERRASPLPHGSLSVPQGQQPQQLGVPFGGRGPIVAAQMMPSRSASALDRLQFDQESPYPNPVRRSPPVRYAPRPPSPPPQLPSIPEKEKDKTTRKSILKSWKSSSSGSISQTVALPEPQSRSSFERSSNGGAPRGRRPSVINFGSTRSSVTSPDIPPSPQIPEYLLNSRGSNSQDHRQSKASRLTISSTDSQSPPNHQTLGARSASPSRSMASSRDSIGSRPSFDASQFEIVSPKTGASLTYPYHGLDHES